MFLLENTVPSREKCPSRGGASARNSVDHQVSLADGVPASAQSAGWRGFRNREHPKHADHMCALTHRIKPRIKVNPSSNPGSDSVSDTHQGIWENNDKLAQLY